MKYMIPLDHQEALAEAVPYKAFMEGWVSEWTHVQL